jgi:hypothetical protein
MDPTSNISRWVGWLLMPLATAVGGFVALKAKTWFGLDVDQGEATAYSLGLMLAIASGFLLWMRNRGKFELAELFGVDGDRLEQVEALAKLAASQLPQSPAITAQQAAIEARALERKALIERGIIDVVELEKIAPWPRGAESLTRPSKVEVDPTEPEQPTSPA